MAVITFQNRSAEFKDALLNRVLVADGAMGTALYAKGIFLNRCYDELNLSLPALIRDVHQEYLRAGAQILETNTYGANRKRLAGFGFAEKLRQINQAGVRIAKEVAQDQAFVAGAVGPLGVRLEPLGPVSFAEARDLFREQVAVLAEAGVDLIILESFRDLDELREAVLAVREAAGREMPLIAQVAIEDDGTLEDGTSAANIALALTQWPVDVIGLNCSSGPRVLLEAIEAMAPHTTKPLSVMPNAGLPVTVDGRNLYLCSPEYMAQYSRRFLEAGAKIVGGCCGTTAAHIERFVTRRAAFNRAGQRTTCRWKNPRKRRTRNRRFLWRIVVRWARSWLRESSLALWRFSLPRAWMPRKKSPGPSCAKTLGSTASTCRTDRGRVPD